MQVLNVLDLFEIPNQRTGGQAGIYSSFCLAQCPEWDHWIPWREFRAQFYDLVAACNHRWGIKGQLSPMNLDSLYKLITFLWAILSEVWREGLLSQVQYDLQTYFKNYYYLSKFQLSTLVNKWHPLQWLAWVAENFIKIQHYYFLVESWIPVWQEFFMHINDTNSKFWRARNLEANSESEDILAKDPLLASSGCGLQGQKLHTLCPRVHYTRSPVSLFCVSLEVPKEVR